MAMVFRLPREKLTRLLSLVRLAKGAKKLQLKQLQLLLGHLVFACRVIRMGRAFCRRLSWATKGVTAPHHYVLITKLAGRLGDLANLFAVLQRTVLLVVGGGTEPTAGVIH